MVYIGGNSHILNIVHDIVRDTEDEELTDTLSPAGRSRETRNKM